MNLRISDITQALRRAMSIVHRRQLKLPCPSQHQVALTTYRPAIRVTWFSRLRYCTKQAWYHEACYKKHMPRNYKQKVKWISYWDMEEDRMCYVCHKYIDSFNSTHTVEMPALEK
jgi:hypothetical protein